jgi:hypothetical protein
MVVAEAETIADTQLRIRGVERQRADLVPRGFLRVTFPTDTSAPTLASSGRLEFSGVDRQPAEPAHGARSGQSHLELVVRESGSSCSRGQLRTTGELPSHPGIASDYLANHFMEQGSSWKKLIREIVLSRAWQQAVCTRQQRGSGKQALCPCKPPSLERGADPRFTPERERSPGCFRRRVKHRRSR